MWERKHVPLGQYCLISQSKLSLSLVIVNGRGIKGQDLIGTDLSVSTRRSVGVMNSTVVCICAFLG